MKKEEKNKKKGCSWRNPVFARRVDPDLVPCYIHETTDTPHNRDTLTGGVELTSDT
jgi:hypothetical protein